MHHSLTTEQPDPAATFDSRLARLGDKAQTARTLLRALAWARGPGLPPGLWRVVAGALSPGEGRHVLAVSDADLAWLLRKVRAWVETTAGPGAVTARRLREVSFAAYLRADTPSCRDDNAPPVAGTATPASAQEQHTAAVERCITGALVATVPLSATGQRDWVSADPYLRAYLAEHAAAAGPGTLSALVQDPGFLAVADPDRLAPLLGPVALDARDAVRAYRRARPMLCGDPRANAAHLAEASWGLTGPPEGDGDAVASPALYRTRLASVRRDDSLLTLAGHTSHLNEVCFGASQDGRMLLATASDDKTVRVWDTLAGELVCDPITGHDDEVWSVAFGRCPDGRLVLASSGKDATVRVWDPLTGAPLIEPITGHTERVYDVKFGTCPDGRLLLGSGSADKTARIWDPLTGAQVGEPYTGHAGRTRSVGFGRLPDGRLLFASGSPDGPARVWDPLTHSSLFTITGQLGKVWEVGFWAGPDGKLLFKTTGTDCIMRFWDPFTGESAGEPFPMLSGPGLAAALGRDGTGRQLLAFTTGDSKIHVWDTHDSTREVATLVSHTGMVQDMRFGTEPGGRLLMASGSGDRTVRIWDRITRPYAPPTTPHVAWVTSLAFGTDPQGQLLLFSASDERALNVWDPQSGKHIGGPFAGHGGWVTSVAFGSTSDGQLLVASAGSGTASTETTVRVWDPLTGELVTGPLTGHEASVRAVAFGATGDGRLLLASADDDGTVQVWDPLTGKALGDRITAHTDGADAVAFATAPDGRLVLASGGGDGVVRLWDPETGAWAADPLIGHTGRVRSVAFGTDTKGRLLLASAGHDKTARIWQPLTSEPARKTLTGHAEWVSSAAFGTAPDGRLLLVTGGGDSTVRVWDPDQGLCIVTIRRESTVHALAVTGLTVAVGQDEGLSVIELDPAAVQAGPP